MTPQERDEKIRAMLAEGKSYRTIGDTLGCSHMTVARAKLTPTARKELDRRDRRQKSERRNGYKDHYGKVRRDADEFTDPEAVLRDVARDKDAQDAARVQAAKLLRDTAGVTADTITELRDVILSAVERHCDDEEGDALVADIQDHLPAQLREIWG